MSHRCIINVTYTDLVSWEKLLYCWGMGIVPLTAFGFSQHWEWSHRAPVSPWFFCYRIMPQIHQSFLNSFELLMEQHHLITEEVSQRINSYEFFDKLTVGYPCSLFFSDLLFLLDSRLTRSLEQVASPRYSAWCPTSTRASLPRSPALAGLPACPRLSGYIWPSILLDLLQSGENHKPINISCSLFFLLISKHLICIPFHNTAAG